MENREDLIGKKLGKYQILEYLGYGSMARVFKAYHSNLDRYIALKVLHNHLAEDAEFMDQFQAEARNLATLRHPNIVQVYDFEIDGRIPYIVMEYIDGPTLKTILHEARKRYTRVPISRSVRIVQNIGAALLYAHKKSMIHRDVKPGNVLLEKTGRVVLGDFGLARLLSTEQHTVFGTVKGTPAYMSPEQGMGLSAENQSDIYSLGVILFELATGQLPFDADNAVALMMMHVNEPIPSPKSFVPELPDRIEHIIMKSTSKDLRKRYSQVSQFLRDLRSLSVEIRTAKFPSASLSQESLQKDVPPPNGEIPGSRDSEISLYFIDTGQLLNIGDGDEYTIGRRHKQQAIIPDIDLTPFKAYEWGISRLHAKISVIKGAVFISDHGSSNGTWIKGERLKPNSYYPVHHGMVVQLGKIRIQVLIYKSIFKKFNL